MNFYKSKKWKTKREKILRRDEYMCRECKRYGRTTPAVTVHHIYPVENWPELALINSNLLSLCNKCHNSMHDRDSGELTQKGEEWMRRISPYL